MESCVACGKADTNLKACAACMLVKYCGVNCQLAHRSEHKHACRKRAAELFDVKLFAEPNARGREECPICCRILPFDDTGICYMGCCGKNIPVLSEFCRFGRISRRPGIVSTQNPNSAESAEFLFDSSVETRGEERSQMLYWKK